MYRTFVVGLAIGLFPTVLAAQGQPIAQQAVTPKHFGTYKMATGEWIPATTSTRSGPEVLFNNTTPTNYYSAGGANQEWVDEGGLKDRNACETEQINGFIFAYCSTQRDLTQNSGTITITFYDDTTPCVGPSAFPVPNCAYQITGLPLGTPIGTIQCWNVTVDLDNGFECPTTLASNFRTEDANGANRRFGWGFLPLQNNTGPIIAERGYRNDPNFVWFDRTNNTFTGCFNLPGGPPANFHMKMFGPPANSRRYYSADPAYPRALDTLALINTTPVTKGPPAETWQVVNTTAGRSYWLVLSSTAVDNPVIGGTATLLAGFTTQLGPSPVMMPGGTLTADIPLTFPGTVLFTQAAETVGPLTAANVRAVSNGTAHCF